MYIIFNAAEDGHITATMLVISDIIYWYSLDCDIKANKMAENKVSEIEILTVILCETLDTKLYYAHFHETFFKRTTFDFNQSSMVGIIIIINDNNMKQSRISLLFNGFIFICYLHGVGRIIVVTVELCHFFNRPSQNVP